MIFASFRVRDNIELLKNRMQSMMDRRDELNCDIDQQTEKGREHLSSIKSLKRQLKRLGKLRDQLKRSLLKLVQLFWKLLHRTI